MQRCEWINQFVEDNWLPCRFISVSTGVFMSRNEEAKKDAERQVSDELANQPKQNGPGTEESKGKRAESEKKLQDIRTEEAATK
jgi:hypothetical protein